MGSRVKGLGVYTSKGYTAINRRSCFFKPQQLDKKHVFCVRV